MRRFFRGFLSIILVLSLLISAVPAFAAEEESVDSEEAIMLEVATQLRSDHSQYVHGYGDGRFGPEVSLTWAEACTILYNLLVDQSMGSCPSTFTDVTTADWYYTAITVLASQGILPCDGGKLNPTAFISRGDFVMLVTRLTGLDETATCDFTDVSTDHPNYTAIATAVKLGWIQGCGDGTFAPDKYLSRAECVTIFNRMLGRTGDAGTASQMDSRYTFTDLPKNHWAFPAVMEAATTHDFTPSDTGEAWRNYWHDVSGTVDWENSDSVVTAAKITNVISSTYSGNFTHDYNWDYSTGLKEAFVNGYGYASDTSYLAWVSLQNQKVYLFYGSKGNWQLYKTFICASGKPTTPTPVCLTRVTGFDAKWYFQHYVCSPVVRFKPNTGYAFHSRLYNYDGSFYDDSIGWPVSEGCIRMLDSDINFLYQNLPLGSAVLVY